MECGMEDGKKQTGGGGLGAGKSQGGTACARPYRSTFQEGQLEAKLWCGKRGRRYGRSGRGDGQGLGSGRPGDHVWGLDFSLSALGRHRCSSCLALGP